MADERTPRFADAAETEQRQTLLRRFLNDVLGLPWAFVSDESHLTDFDGVLTREELISRCQAVYGVTLEAHQFSIPIWRVLDELEAARERRDSN
jgi:Mn-dependent DtxR family transcriptional regulator